MDNKYWEKVLASGARYEDVNKTMHKHKAIAYATRPEWNGVHFVSKDGFYCILLKTGTVLIRPTEILDTDKDDWMLVSISDEATLLLQRRDLI